LRQAKPLGSPNLSQDVILGFTVEDFEKRMSVLAQNVFGRQVSLDDVRKEVPSWDSLSHFKLVIAFESEFNVRIPIQRIETIQSLRELGEFV
jgi:acyl carrier protein